MLSARWAAAGLAVHELAGPRRRRARRITAVDRRVTLMPDARWERIKDLFDEVRTLSPTLRGERLAQACGTDTALRAEVESLLVAEQYAGDFLESPALASTESARAVSAETDPVALADLSGHRIGAYRVLRELGRGGMGVVYLGARDDEAFRKLVAIKVVQGGAIRPGLLHRFEEERRILAGLDHPNIARLLDAGTTGDGVPYVVMEHVEGQPIDVYCRARGRPVRERLELFARVCAAVQYSHQRLVVHQDIKAGNILITPEGVPKLLDFGIAKMVSSGDGDDGTRTLFRALTPESASPEQVTGDAVTVASDVYSLGVLLYRLLTDVSPYGTTPRTNSELVHAICEQQPVRPSDAVADRDGVRQLRGDLDLIALKALRKEPERRYASVEQLDRDLERHLTGRPVLAGAGLLALPRRQVPEAPAPGAGRHRS